VRRLGLGRHRGFDALTGVQDVAAGLQLGTVVERGTSPFGNHENDLFVAVDLYAGRGSVSSFAALGTTRTVLRLEERWAIGRLTRHGSFGLSSFADAGWEIRLASAGTRPFWTEPDDLARGRAGAAPSTIFGWP
jgi:hypothetical protein